MSIALQVALVMVTILVVLLVIGAPIGVAIGMSSAVSMICMIPADVSFATSAQRIFAGSALVPPKEYLVSLLVSLSVFSAASFSIFSSKSCVFCKSCI